MLYQSRAVTSQCRTRLTPHAPARRLHTVESGGERQSSIARALSDRELQVKMSIATHTDRLDLSDCQLSQLDPSLFSLSNLRELSLAGNQLTQLPSAVSQLTALEKLVVAGNQFTQLPEEVGQLEHLEGLWAHGNLLTSLPESLKQLTGLKALSVAGNQLSSICGDTLAALTTLTDLNLSGNRLSSLPPTVGCLSRLKKLALHGNQLEELPGSWSSLQQLEDLCLQGNQLTSVPEELGTLGMVEELSLADNQLTVLPEDLSGMTNLQKLHLYGNQLQQMPLGPSGLPALLPTLDAEADDEAQQGAKLRALWLEGNPLSDSCVAGLLAAVPEGLPPAKLRLGLDEQQLAGVDPSRVGECKAVRRGVIKGSGRGYFKLQRAPEDAAAAAVAAGTPRVLVVALGSAPGLPNWGGTLSRVAAEASEPEHRCFDVLFVVDPLRSWYHGGEPELLEQVYRSRLRQYTEQYSKVIMVGDSMGATASLLFSDQATTVLSFCPQVDLSTSSIRPGQPQGWQQTLQEQLQAAVGSSNAEIRVFTGTWQHDVSQASLLQHHKHVEIKVYSYDSHRLALALAAQGRLTGLLEDALLQAMGCSTKKPVRLTNYL